MTNPKELIIRYEKIQWEVSHPLNICHIQESREYTSDRGVTRTYARSVARDLRSSSARDTVLPLVGTTYRLFLYVTYSPTRTPLAGTSLGVIFAYSSYSLYRTTIKTYRLYLYVDILWPEHPWQGWVKDNFTYSSHSRTYITILRYTTTLRLLRY